ncbi:hypothetical protein NKR23_g12297 [Pleurostoma richardsiae]|uniref:Uncharacterized protein n=1 Tax=Pleurostoma richardsiae TaxID=41990 RepID=A0AA38R658_9PEZI|nr:hypothetical protein NKR23_g12297 [Pleurostoma richardsiae]
MAGSANTITLRRLLTQPKPEVPCKTKASKNSTGQWPTVGIDAIRLWDQFNIDILNESYGHILDLEIPVEQLAEAPRAEDVLEGMEITKPTDILHLIGWNDRVLRPTLAFAKQHLHLHTSVRLQHDVAAADNSSFARIMDGRRPIRVDHRVALDDFPLPHLVIGLGRSSSKFQGRLLAGHSGKTAKENLWPLRQLANLCDLAKTRYGYIVTDQDLVACCFYKTEAARSGQTAGSTEVVDWKVALMPVPWTKYGEEQLTTDLALWWLCMLALSAPHHRNLPTEEPSPPAYQPPSPGNPGALAAVVGINIDPIFDLGADLDGFDFDFGPDITNEGQAGSA